MENQPIQQAPYQPGQDQNKEPVSKDKLLGIIVVIELVLLIVFGWQLFDLKRDLTGGEQEVAKVSDTAVKERETDTAPAAAAPSVDPVNLSFVDGENIKGSKDAKVLIFEYSDFECPFCGKAFPTVSEVLETYGDDVAVIYRHFPLSFHAQAQKAAEASECAADQGKFWDYHDIIFENQTLLAGGIDQLKIWASDIGLNRSSFDECLESGEKAAKVKGDMDSGQAAGVTGTPAFFISGKKISGAQPFSAFQTVIDAELDE